MVRKAKLYEKALGSPGSLSFDELCSLAKQAGFVFRKQRGSHRVYKHPENGEMMNFQPDGNMAKKYQVIQLLKTIKQYGLIKED
ncbi:MAG: type II toxin-antitoxin system HicA family toxin [Desulfococcaceae bacterium]